MDRLTASEPTRQTGSQCHPTLGEQEEREGFIFPRTGGRDMPLLPPGTHYPMSFSLFSFLRAIILLSALDLVFFQSPCCGSIVLFFPVYLNTRESMHLRASTSLLLWHIGQVSCWQLVIAFLNLPQGSERHVSKPSVSIRPRPWLCGQVEWWWWLRGTGGWTPPSSRGHLLTFTAPQPSLTTALLVPRRLIKLSMAHTPLTPTHTETHTHTHTSSYQLCEFHNTNRHTKNHPPTQEEIRNVNTL